MKPRILIVDDEKILLTALKRVFQADGFDVTAVNSGTAAITAVQNEKKPFSTALVDLLMPDMTGTDLIKWLAENSPQTQLMAMSALTDAATTESLKPYNVRGFLVKPFEDIFQAPKTVMHALRCAKDHPGKGRN